MSLRDLRLFIVVHVVFVLRLLQLVSFNTAGAGSVTWDLPQYFNISIPGNALAVPS